MKEQARAQGVRAYNRIAKINKKGGEVKKIVCVLVVVVVLLSALSVVSCNFTGVSQEEYDKVVAELDEFKVKAQVTSLQNELNEVKARNQSVETHALKYVALT